jgi:acetyl-CoA carboxylase carboxyltransferase component
MNSRFAFLFDTDQPIVEYGAQAVAQSEEVDAPGDGVSVVMGAVHGRTTIALCCDESVAGGTHGVIAHLKMQRGLELARHLDAPLVQIMEGGGFRPTEPPYYAERRDLVHHLIRLSGRVPIVGLALGRVADLRALQLGVSDVIIATGSATISLDEPAPAEGEEAPETIAQLESSGAVDMVAADDEDALARARQYLELMTMPLVAMAQRDESEIREALRNVVPESPRRAIDGRRLTELIADEGTVLRLRERFGGALQTSLGRIGGRTVGFIASHSMVNAGAIDSPASDKFARFVQTCDTFGLPIVYLADVPGLLAGQVAEQTAMNRHSTRPYFAQVYSRVPQLTVVVRRAYGQGMVVMGMGDQVEGRALQVVWPTAQLGGMGLGGAAAITASSSVAVQTGESRSETELYRDLMDYGSAFRLAERFGADEAIDPGATRDRLMAAVGRLPVLPVRQPARALDAW